MYLRTVRPALIADPAWEPLPLLIDPRSSHFAFLVILHVVLPRRRDAVRSARTADRQRCGNARALRTLHLVEFRYNFEARREHYLEKVACVVVRRAAAAATRTLFATQHASSAELLVALHALWMRKLV